MWLLVVAYARQHAQHVCQCCIMPLRACLHCYCCRLLRFAAIPAVYTCCCHILLLHHRLLLLLLALPLGLLLQLCNITLLCVLHSSCPSTALLVVVSRCASSCCCRPLSAAPRRS